MKKGLNKYVDINENKYMEPLKDFDKKYGRDYDIPSEPENYIHRGVDYSFQLSDIKNFIKEKLEEQKKDSFVQGYNQALEDTGQKIKPDVPEKPHKAPDKV